VEILFLIKVSRNWYMLLTSMAQLAEGLDLTSLLAAKTEKSLTDLAGT
jgi:hypothetical protein